MTWVAIGIVAAALGAVVLVVPALRLWRAVTALGREVRRVSNSLAEAGAALDVASRRLPSLNNPRPVGKAHVR